ncbi:MAG TPA: VWA domain-containing protein [Candidatus Nitrosotalea sp.]|nr:VWA domain-containing protein [Candidatus Nitrosotalea sp.]
MSGYRYRYSRWDGTQVVDDLDADQILDLMADDYLSFGDVGHALQRLQRWGDGDLAGMEDLLAQLRERREQELSRYNLDGSLEEIRRALDEVVEMERAGQERRLAEAAEGDRSLLQRIVAQRQDQLDRVPDDLGGRVKALRDYEFMDDEARQSFEQLLTRLQGEMLEQAFQGLKQGVANMRQEDLPRIRDMVRSLNRMLEERAAGREPDFAEFKNQFGDLFPPQIETLDQLIDHLQRQMAQMDSLLRSLSPEARAELQGMMDQLLQDDSLRLELARLGGLMSQLAPPSALSESYPFFGQESPSMREAMGLMDRLQAMDRLGAQMERGRLRPGDVDAALAEEILGLPARRQLERIRRLSEELERAGYLERHGSKLELTPRGMRRLGQGALREIFAQLTRSRLGQHPTRDPGQGVDAGEEIKPYEFGDPFLLDLKETLFASLQREGRSLPLHLRPDDFMVHRSEHLSEAATVLMIDMSRSMFLRGCFLAAKKVAMALDSLIRSQFPRDHLYVVGFSSHAVQMKPQSLPAISLNDYVYGTNMQHGFMLARSLLARHRGQRQIIMITDGEPTAHLENGRVVFAYPPTFRTIQATMREVVRVTRDHIVINTFMLERSRYLTEFVDQMARVNRGRAFFVSPERLGEYVVDDFVSGRRRRRRAS